jgi:hypothetical protein
MNKHSGLICLNHKAFGHKKESYKATTLEYSTGSSETYHKRIPPPVRELIGAMVNRELTECLDLLEQLFNCDTEQALTHLAAIQGGVR